MSFNTTKITVFYEVKEKEEDVNLFYSTITDNVGITCGEQEVFLTCGQFEALAYLMRRCFYTRDMLDEAQNILDKKNVPIPSISLTTKRNGKWRLKRIDMTNHDFYQYSHGDNGGGKLNTTICPTITICSWPCNCFLIEEYD